MKSPRFFYSVGVSFAALTMTSFVLSQGTTLTPSAEALKRAEGAAAITADPRGFTKPQPPETLLGGGDFNRLHGSPAPVRRGLPAKVHETYFPQLFPANQMTGDSE